MTTDPDTVNYDHILVIDHIPIIPSDKLPKLFTAIKKILTAFGPLQTDIDRGYEGIYIPTDSEGASLGYCFVEYESKEQAHQALHHVNGYKLDKNHVFEANLFTDIEKYTSWNDQYIPPPKEDYIDMEYLKEWLTDEHARDMLAIRFADETQLLWGCQHNEMPEFIYERKNWTETYLQWSPQGAYLCTFHRQGIASWGGKSWKKWRRFPHPNVKFMEFSPNEKYLVTWSPEIMEDEMEPKQVIVWDVSTGSELRGFNVPRNSIWPMFKWSHDDKYLCRLGENMLSVYETPEMTLIDKKSIKIEGIKDFVWSPTANIICYWTPESGNQPAKVTLIDIPSRAIIRTKNLFSVTECKIQWQSNGDYLAVKVDRYTKSKKSTFTSFEIFDIREKEIPVDTLEMKESIVAFAWEPNGGDVLAIIHAGEQATGKNNVSFYSLEKKKGTTFNLNLLKTLEKKNVNSLYWSPRGQFIVLAGLKNLNGTLEFWNTRDSFEMMASTEHFMATDVEWDPSGRLVATVSSAWRHQLENGYYMWDFKGRLIHRQIMDRFYQLLWRPRPPTLLSKEKQKEIRKNLKDYSKQFEQMDELRESGASRRAMEEHTRLLDDWHRFIMEREQQYAEQAPQRAALLGSHIINQEDQEYEVTQEIIEEIIHEQIEYIEE